jgi:DNA-directed RNA polymerase subunit beta'
MPTTIGKLLVNQVLPPGFQTDAVLNKDAADELLARIAETHPDKYREISHKLMQLGADTVYTEGTTLRLSDTRVPVDRAVLLQHVKDQTRRIAADDSLSKDDKEAALAGVFALVQDDLKKQTYAAALAANNPFALQVKSKARGNQSQLMSLMTTPGIYEDADGKVVPTFIRRSYAEGLRPHEYWAATYGARKSVISTKFATRDAGDLGKQFGAAANATLVTEDDCETAGGLPVDTDDTDNLGTVLARDVGKFKAGTVISAPVLAELKKHNDKIVIRSPITCGAKRGICKQCAGIRETGDFPEIGYNIGVNAASALAERIAQSSLNVKHSGGVAGSKGETVYAGFPIVEQLAQVPETFPHAAPLASLDGRVDEIRDAPQGGQLIVVNGETHYVPAGRKLYVAAGDTVEAGDQLASGIIDPSEVVQYKGIGEGRRYFANRMTQAFRDTDYGVNRRNVEVLARSMIDHVVSDDVDGSDATIPGEIVSYNTMVSNYRPRKDAAFTAPTAAVGSYLEQPVLHYTVGTKITRKVADELGKFGHNRVMVHKNSPPFIPSMQSLRKVPQHEPDWVARLGSSYLGSGLLKSVHRGATSNLHGLNPVPGIAKGVELGKVPPGTAGY